MFSNIINILIFFKWKNKEPHHLLYFSISITDFLLGCVTITGPLSRIITFPVVFKNAVKFTMASTSVFLYLSATNIVLISVDRWLSVEFPVYYNNGNITHRKIIQVLVAMWTYYMFDSVLVFSFLNEYIIVTCYSPGVFTYKGTWWIYFNGLQSGLLVSIVVLCQCRILAISLRMYFYARRRRKVLPTLMLKRLSNVVPSTVRPSRRHLYIPEGVTATVSSSRRCRRRPMLTMAVVKKVVAGSIVVIMVMVCQFPMGLIGFSSTPPGFVAYVTIVDINFMQYILKTVVYFACFPQYRMVVLDFFRTCIRQQ